MPDFSFLQNPISKRWIVLAPRRAKRPDVAKGFEPVCPFCVGREGDEEEVYRISPLVIASSAAQNVAISEIASSPASPDPHNDNSDWLVRVLNNKYPFAKIHEVIVHSPDHHKNFDALPLEQARLILQTYRQRFLTHQDSGQVYIFHNRGEGGGESLPHPHTQLAVIPFEVKTEIPRLDPAASFGFTPKPLTLSQKEEGFQEQDMVETPNFYLFCPRTSQWPDEVWISPKKRGRMFSEITDEELVDFAKTLQRLIQIFDYRHGNEFPFNFYIYPGGDWYLRLIPRFKSLGGFEVGTGIFINTQDPNETMKFIKEHFDQTSAAPDIEKIRKEQQAEYKRHV